MHSSSTPSASRDRDDGSASLQLVLATPILLSCVLMIVQFALWFHAHHVVIAAAQEGERAARATSATAADGELRAQQFLADVGGRVLSDAQVTAARDGQSVRVEVRAHAVSILPWVDLPVSALAEGPVEAFRPDLPEAGP